MRNKINAQFFECENQLINLNYKNICRLDECWKTPFYLFDERTILRQTEHLKASLGSSIDICYSMKTNPYILPIISDVLPFIEVSSETELDICKKFAIPGEKIIYEGVLKTLQGMEKALNYPVRSISIESIAQWQSLKKLLKSRNFPVILRLSSGNQFGLTEQEILSLIKDKTFGAQIQGIHYYSGTQKKNAQELKSELTALKKTLSHIKEKGSFQIKELEIGCGIGMPHFQEENIKDYQNAMNVVTEALASWSEDYHIVYEAGRLLTAPAGIFVTKVFDRKEMNGRSFVFVDGGTNHLSYYGSMLGARTPVLKGFGSGELESTTETIICGPLCTSNDILARNAKLSTNIKPGDYITFYYTGAYSITDSPLAFLSMDTPAILLKNRMEEIQLLRGHINTYFE